MTIDGSIRALLGDRWGEDVPLTHRAKLIKVLPIHWIEAGEHHGLGGTESGQGGHRPERM